MLADQRRYTMHGDAESVEQHIAARTETESAGVAR
jgi:hypothetical protein